MKVFVLDITGRNPVQYNPSLCEALSQKLPSGSVFLLSPNMHGDAKDFRFLRLLRLVPQKWVSKAFPLKRGLRAFESLINYLYIILIVSIYKPDILHVQWLVFLDYFPVEKYFFSLLKRTDSKLKIYLTVHNIYPHEMGEEQRCRYRQRFSSVDKYMSGYLVHLKSARKELNKEYGIDIQKIFVAYHGIYTAEGYVPSSEKRSDDKMKIIMYGYQTRYKGADILVEALNQLPASIISHVQTMIIGYSSPELYQSCVKYFEKLNITWINRYVSDEELYKAIGDADLILLPYRKISQSGVLLLALSYRKPIMTSKLPSFVETLQGYPMDYFFEPDNSHDLAEKLLAFVDGRIDKRVMINVINDLIPVYSWEHTAESTIAAYCACS